MIKVGFQGKFQAHNVFKFNLPGFPTKDETSETTVWDVFTIQSIFYISNNCNCRTFFDKSLFILKTFIIIIIIIIKV